VADSQKLILVHGVRQNREEGIEMDIFNLVATSKVVCNQTEDYTLRPENAQIAPCKLYKGWVERRWCYYKCPYFKGLQEEKDGVKGEFVPLNDLMIFVQKRRAIALKAQKRVKPRPAYVNYHGP